MMTAPGACGSAGIGSWKAAAVFKYTAGETVIEDYVIPEAGALPAFTRQLTLTGSGKYYYLAAADGFIELRVTVGR